jgi:hypothetical protein
MKTAVYVTDTVVSVVKKRQFSCKMPKNCQKTLHFPKNDKIPLEIQACTGREAGEGFFSHG